MNAYEANKSIKKKKNWYATVRGKGLNSVCRVYWPLHPIPQVQQQERRFSAEMLGWLSPLLAIQILSEIASTAPKAQHDPQFPWSRMVLKNISSAIHGQELAMMCSHDNLDPRKRWPNIIVINNIVINQHHYHHIDRWLIIDHRLHNKYY